MRPINSAWLYSAIDGLYRVRIYCDVLITADQPNYRLRIGPLTGHAPPVKNEVRLNAMTCQGHYDSESAFSAAGHQTQIEYRLNLRANVPMPVTLRLIPTALISGAAHNILHLRTAEIMSSFIGQKMTVTVTSSNLNNNNERDTLKLSTIYSYWYFR